MSSSPSMILVDDDEGISRLFARTLSGQYPLTLFASAEAFLAKAELKDCDIVFADVNLPGMSGLELTRRLKTAALHCDVIIITGEPTLDTAIAALKTGAYDFLTKPFPADQLLAVTQRCLEKRRLSTELAAVKLMQEELLAAYSQLKSAERMKEAFLSVIGHELRTPLAKILTGVSLIDADAAAPPAPTIISAIKTGAGELHATIEDLILYADSQKEPQPKDCAGIDLNKVTRQACAELSSKAEAAGVSLSALYSPDEALVTGSHNNIAKAVKHLIINAIAFNRQGGTVQVETARTMSGVTVTVRDTGIGIPKDLISGLGNPFYQVADYMTRKTGGLGLGLAIVKQVVEAHKGSLTIKSVPGEGTTFTLAFQSINPCLQDAKR
ncbi:MAG TPA: hypothetical protein DCS63_10065 [Elusimicrobia bacterium]|nr:hypothetical protein [Elusimicrobiota bacterium]